MKRIYFIFAFVLLGLACFSSCTKEELVPIPPQKEEEKPITPEPETELSDYTIIMLGVGGSNLDLNLYKNLNEVVNADKSKKVSFVGIFKYSNHLQESTKDEFEKGKDKQGNDALFNIPVAYRKTFKLSKSYKNESNDGISVSNYGEANLAFYDPNVIAKFIDEAVAEFPAKKYILTVWNHGSFFDEDDNSPVAKSIVFDDNVGKERRGITIFELENGIKNSNKKKVDMIYGDLCLMNNIETVYQLSKVTDYFLGSANLVPGVGGDYTALLNTLGKESNLEKAMKKYIYPLVQTHWKKSRFVFGDYQDISLLDVRKIEPVITAFTDVSKRYIELYSEAPEELKTTLNKIQMSGTFESVFEDDNEYYRIENGGKFYYHDGQTVLAKSTKLNLQYYFESVQKISYSVTDIYSSFYSLNEVLQDSTLREKLKNLKDALDQMTVFSSQVNIPSCLKDPAGISVCWLTNKRYNGGFFGDKKSTDGRIYKTVYPSTAFNIATSWNKYFDIYKSTYPYAVPVSLEDIDKYIFKFTE